MGMLDRIRWLKFKGGAHRLMVLREEYGEAWPFTLRSAVLWVRDDCVWVEDAGNIYPLNGTADMHLPLHGAQVAPLEDIWRDNPAYPDLQLRVSIAPLITVGLEAQP